MLSIEPFYFGRDEELFGLYHPASGNSKGHAVVIAGPLLNESMRAHYSLRQIGMRLARDGFDVLRFDYSGMGNSKSSTTTVSPSQWESNISVAAREVIDIAGSDRMSIVATRFAANLAAPLTEERYIDRFVMWDPILTGDRWLASLQRAQDALSLRFGNSTLDRTREFTGHLMSRSFVSELLLQGMPTIQSENPFAVVTNNYGEMHSLERTTNRIDKVDFDCGWADLTSQVLYAHDVIDSVCASLR